MRNWHRHAIEQASRRWRGGRRDDSARTRRKILISTQVVNQKNVLWDHLSCRDHLSLFARLRGVDIEGDARHAAEQALAVVGLSDHADKAAGRLSGGMKRKLAVAVALVGGPSVVLLDEPSSGLDPGAQRNLWDLIKVTMKGRAVVLTTHSMGEADLLCDRVGIMVKGTMRCIGTPQELKERYAAGYEISCRLETRDDAHVADLVAFAREAFSSPDVDVAAADADIATLELAGVDPRRTPALAFRAFDDDACARLGVIDFSLARATMEKVFLRIAGGEEGLAQSRLGREIAEMLQAEADDEAQRELDAVVFSEATCCGCHRTRGSSAAATNSAVIWCWGLSLCARTLPRVRATTQDLCTTGGTETRDVVGHGARPVGRVLLLERLGPDRRVWTYVRHLVRVRPVRALVPADAGPRRRRFRRAGLGLAFLVAPPSF